MSARQLLAWVIGAIGSARPSQGRGTGIETQMIQYFFFFFTCQVKSFRWSELSGKSHFLRLSQIRSSTRAVGVVTCPNPTPRTRVASAIFMKQRKELKRNFLKSIDGFKISKFGFFPLLYNNISGCGLPLLGDIEQIFD